MPAQPVAGYGIGVFHLRQRALRRSAHCTCKRPGHAVDEAIRSAHVTPALREVDVGPTAHRRGGVAFTTAMARRHERRMAAGECLVADAGYSGRFEAGQQDLFEYLGRKSTARQELDDSPPAALDTADAAGREDGGHVAALMCMQLYHVGGVGARLIVSESGASAGVPQRALPVESGT